MQIAKELAGFSGAKADDLRKAIGKKNRAAMAALKPEFVEGCRASGTKPEVIEFLWQTNEKSADYSFNKSHAACYALIAYRTAWLKANYTGRVHGGADLLGDVDQGQGAVLRRALRGDGDRDPAARRQPLRPRVHGRARATSASAWTPSRASATRRSRRSSARASEGGEFTLAVGLLRARRQPHGQQEGDRGADQVRRLRLDRRHPQGHARGARAGPGRRPEGPAGRADRPGLDLRPAGRRRGAGAAGGPRRARPPRWRRSRGRVHPPIPTEEFEQAELLAAEKEAIGLFVSAHPLKPLREALRARVDCPLAALADRRDKDWVTVGGIITEAKRIRTRNGDHMMFATLDDLAGAVEMLVFGKALAEHEAALAVDEVVLVQGPRRPQGSGQDLPGGAERRAPSRHPRRRSSARRTQADAAATTATALAQPVHLRVAAAEPRRRARSKTASSVIEEFPGPAEVVLEIDTSAGTRRLRLGEAYRVQHTPTLRAELEHVLAPVAAPCAPQRPALHATALSRLLAACGRRCPARAARSRARLPRAPGPSRFSPGVSSTHGSFCRPGADRNAAQPSSPSSPSPRLAWRSRFEPSGVWESLRCSERTRPRPSLRVASRSDALMPVGGADVIAGGEQVAGVQAHAEALARRRRPRAARASSSNERPSVPPAPAVFSRCSSQPSLSASASRDRLAGAGDRLADIAGLGRARVQDHAAGADRLADAQRVRQRGERFGADVGVLAGAVEQVDGVDQHGVDRAVRHRLAERRDVLLAVGVGFHMRGDWLKIWIARQPRSTPRSIAFGRPPGGRDVRSD